jgi:type IV pilus assembly protein PilO
MDININKLNKLRNLPVIVQVLIAAAPSLLIIALFVFLVYMPKNREMTTLQAKIVKLDSDISNAESKIRRLDDLIVENSMLREKLALLKEQLPEEKEVSVLLKQISELGQKAGLEILLWRPEARKTNPEGLYVEIPVRVEVRTGYHNLGDFLSQISRLPRLVNISDLSLTKKGRRRRSVSGDAITAKFTARTFASIDARSAAAVAATGKKKKRK